MRTRSLVDAVGATSVVVALLVVFEVLDVDTDIDTGNNVAKGAVYVAMLWALVAWCAVLVGALRVAVRRATSRPRGGG